MVQLWLVIFRLIGTGVDISQKVLFGVLFGVLYGINIGICYTLVII